MSLETSLLSVDPESSDDNRNERKDKKKPSAMPWLPRSESDAPPAPVAEAKPFIPGPIFAEFAKPKQETADDEDYETEEDDDDEDREESAEREYDDTPEETGDGQQDEAPEPPLILNHAQIGEGTLYTARVPESAEAASSEDSEEAPQTPPEFEELIQQLGPFAEAHATDGLQEPSEVASEANAEEDAAPPMVAGTPPPPPPPIRPFGPAAAAQPSPPPRPQAAFNATPPQPPNWNMGPPGGGFSPNYNMAPAPSVSAAEHVSALRSTEKDAEKRGMRKGLIAGFITGYALKAYLDKRKRERYEKNTAEQLQEHRDTIARLHAEQAQTQNQVAAVVAEQQPRPQPVRQERPAAMPQPSRMEGPMIPAAAPVEALPPIKVAAEQASDEPEIFDQEGNKIILQPGQRVERSAGGYSVVLDEHNRLVHDAIHYGEAFKRDQKREQLSFDPFATATAMPTAAVPNDGTVQLPEPRLESGQADFAHELPSGQPRQVDVQHRLPKPRNPVVSAVVSPWLWTAIAVLLIAYFVAALA